MAWYDRITSAVRSITRAIFGPPQPEEVTVDEEEEPLDRGPVEPAYPAPEPVYGEPYEPEPWFPSEEPMFDEGDPWFNQEIALYDANGQYIGSMTKAEWKGELLRTSEELMDEYGFSNIDIIDALEESGYWDQYDWEEWRAYYGALYGHG